MCFSVRTIEMDLQQQKQIDRIRDNPWDFLLDLGMKKAEEESGSAVLSFLCECAQEFIQDLFRTSGLEELREMVELVPDSNRIEQLLNCVPFVKDAAVVNVIWSL